VTDPRQAVDGRALEGGSHSPPPEPALSSGRLARTAVWKSDANGPRVATCMIDRNGGRRSRRLFLSLPVGEKAFPQEIPTAMRALRRTPCTQGADARW